MKDLGIVVRYLGRGKSDLGRIIYSDVYDGLDWFFVKLDGRLKGEWIPSYRIVDKGTESDWLAYAVSRVQWAVYETICYTRIGKSFSRFRFRYIKRTPLLTPVFEWVTGGFLSRLPLRA